MYFPCAYHAAMTEKEALAYMRSHVEQIGVKRGIEVVSRQTKVPWNTAYGWWRRESIPDWRLPAFAKRKARRQEATA